LRRNIHYVPERREIKVTVRRDVEFPRELLRILNREGLILKPLIDASGRRRKSITLTLAEHDSLPSNNLLERLAYWLSRVPGYRVAHDPWEIGGRPVNIGLAVELVIDTILGFDEQKLRGLTV
jgi:hypothetical protein